MGVYAAQKADMAIIGSWGMIQGWALEVVSSPLTQPIAKKLRKMRHHVKKTGQFLC